MYADIFFNFAGAKDLRDAAKAAFDALGISEFEERESSNYVDGRYFVANRNGLTFEIAQSDYADAGELRFWLSIDGDLENADGTKFDRMIDGIAREDLRGSGAQVARVHDLGKKVMRVVSY
jgi:hypothetical protein